MTGETADCVANKPGVGMKWEIGRLSLRDGFSQKPETIEDESNL